MKVDFSKVSINATVEGDPVVIDLTKEVGNLVYGRTAFRDLWLNPSRRLSWDPPLSPP